MAVHVFASYGMDTYLVEADSEAAAKGLMWDEDPTGTVKYLGEVGEVVDGVTKVSAP